MASTKRPHYWHDASALLAKRDARLRKLVKAHGHQGLTSRGDAFSTLARSIVGQQISVKAAQAVWERFSHTVGRMRPADVLVVDEARLRAAGLSNSKARYLRDLARHFDDGSVNPRRWRAMDDESIIEELIIINGIGRWTAEMFLIFHLLRPDVLPLGDLGLLKAVYQLYNGGEPMHRDDVAQLGERWAPYRTVATWYLWRSLDPIPVVY